jgi:hypothetical protein
MTNLNNKKQTVKHKDLPRPQLEEHWKYCRKGTRKGRKRRSRGHRRQLTTLVIIHKCVLMNSGNFIFWDWCMDVYNCCSGTQ